MNPRTASAIEVTVQRALARSLNAAELRVSLVGNVVYLEGTVPSLQHKAMAAETARLLTGAAQVVNRLRVAPSRATGDRPLREAVLKALPARVGGGTHEVSVQARGGVIELKGSVVSLADRCAAGYPESDASGQQRVHGHLL